jgi:hypothetical protein
VSREVIHRRGDATSTGPRSDTSNCLAGTNHARSWFHVIAQVHLMVVLARLLDLSPNDNRIQFQIFCNHAAPFKPTIRKCPPYSFLLSLACSPGPWLAETMQSLVWRMLSARGAALWMPMGSDATSTRATATQGNCGR